jgi:hypothetical protein
MNASDKLWDLFKGDIEEMGYRSDSREGASVAIGHWLRDLYEYGQGADSRTELTEKRIEALIDFVYRMGGIG